MREACFRDFYGNFGKLWFVLLGLFVLNTKYYNVLNDGGTHQ